MLIRQFIKQSYFMQIYIKKPYFTNLINRIYHKQKQGFVWDFFLHTLSLLRNTKLGGQSNRTISIENRKTNKQDV